MVVDRSSHTRADRRSVWRGELQVLAFAAMVATVARTFMGHAGALVLAGGILVLAALVWAVLALVDTRHDRVPFVGR